MVGYWNQDPTRVRLFEQEKLESERLDEANCPADCQSESAHQMHEVIARGAISGLKVLKVKPHGGL